MNTALTEHLLRMSNEIRGVGRSRALSVFLALEALYRFGHSAGSDGLSADWRNLRNQLFHTAAPSRQSEFCRLIQQLAGSTEAQHPYLKGVFTDILLRDLTGLESLILDWLRACELHEPGETPEDPFADFLDERSETILLSDSDLGPMPTSRSLANFLVSLAEVGTQNTILDPCCGLGTVLMAAASEATAKKLHVELFGQEPNRTASAVAKLRLYFGRNPFEISVSDPLSGCTRPGGLDQFDRVLLRPPRSSRLRSVGLLAARPRLQEIFEFSLKVYVEILFLAFGIDCLEAKGRLVASLPVGFLFRRGADARLRQYILDAELLDAVITVPPKAFPDSAVQEAFIVLDRERAKRHKGSALMIDIVDQKIDGASAIRLLEDRSKGSGGGLTKTESPIGRRAYVPLSQIRANDYSFQPQRYLQQEVELTKGGDRQQMMRQASELEKRAKTLAASIDNILTKIK